MRKNFDLINPSKKKLSLNCQLIGGIQEMGKSKVIMQNKEKMKQNDIEKKSSFPLVFPKEKQNYPEASSLSRESKTLEKEKRTSKNFDQSKMRDESRYNIIKNRKEVKSKTIQMSREKSFGKKQFEQVKEIKEIIISKTDKIDELVEKLINNLFKFSKLKANQNAVSINVQELSFLLTALIKGSTPNLKKSPCDSILCFKLLQDMKSDIELFRIQSKMTKLNMISSYDITIDPDQYVTKLTKITSSIQSLQKKEDCLILKIKGLQQKVQQYEEICMEKFEQITQWEQRTYHHRVFLNEFREKAQLLEKKVAEGEKELRKINEEGELIRTFCQRQKEKPLMELVAKQFKQVIDDIFDYAVFLQHDARFSSLTWEPKPFTVVEKYMEKDFENVDYFLKRKDKSLEEKQHQLVTFLKDCFHKFKVKDEEMMVVHRDKTEAIRHFIQMMQKWATNFDIQKDTLIDLRKQFVVDSNEINQLILTLRSNEHIAVETVVKLEKHWHQIEDNYKYGNYFY